MIYPTLSFRAQRGICFFFSASSVPSVLNLCSFLCFRTCLLNPSQLLRFFLLDQPVSSPRYPLQRQRPQSDAFQFFQRVLFLEQHAPQLFLLRIPHPHFVPIIRRSPPRSIRLPHRLHLHANFLSQTLQVHECQHAFHFHLIDLFQLRPVVQHFRRQVAVIRQKYQPRRTVFQIPHRKHALRQTAQTIAQRLPPFRVVHRRHHFRRLVQHHVNAPSCVRFDNFPRRLNPVLRRVRLRSQLLHYAPIHAHLSAGDQQFRMPPRSNPRPRNDLLQSFLHGFFLTISGRGTIHRALLSVGLYFISVLRLLLRLFLTSLLCHRFSSSFHSPAAVAFCALSFSPSGIPSLFAAVSSSNSSRASISAWVAFPLAALGPSSAVPRLATRHSSLATSPISLPTPPRASASNSFKLGNSSKSLSPNRIKNSFDVLYKIGRPITSFRPAVVIRCLSSSVLITPEVFTPRISEISGEVTGCLYAITASVSSAGIDSRSGGRKLLINRRTTSCCCGLVYTLYPPATARISIPRSSPA